MADIELVDAVATVRDELLTAAARGVGQEVEFVVGPDDLGDVSEHIGR